MTHSTLAENVIDRDMYMLLNSEKNDFKTFSFYKKANFVSSLNYKL